jgi:hypothetical protein
MDEVIGGWRKLHNGELRNMHSSPNTFRTIKSKKIRWEEYVAHVGRIGMHIGIWWEIHKERDQYEDQNVGMRMILSRVGWYARRK